MPRTGLRKNRNHPGVVANLRNNWYGKPPPGSQSPEFEAFFATPTVAARRTKAMAAAKRALAEIENPSYKNGPLKQYSWVLDPARKRQRKAKTLDPYEKMLAKVNASLALKRRRTQVGNVGMTNRTVLELIDIATVSGLTIFQLIEGFVCMGIEGLYTQLDASATTLDELKETHDSGESLARFAYAPPPAHRPSSTRGFPVTEAHPNRPQPGVYPTANHRRQDA
jgi:hypothetical protein